ncbi:MAG: hypothetical protein J6U30_06950, partial [Oscillospiraceae bacterium]|nr:hypothetical protein [Oscillospiraceae bacterium]
MKNKYVEQIATDIGEDHHSDSCENDSFLPDEMKKRVNCLHQNSSRASDDISFQVITRQELNLGPLY